MFVQSSEAASYWGVEYGIGKSDCRLGDDHTPTERRSYKSDC